MKSFGLRQVGLEKNEKDGSHRAIVDLYNSHLPRPRNIKMGYNMAWCACTWSAIAIALGYTDIMPIEISCGELIKKAKTMGIWVENDAYVPKPGDAILYDWSDSGKGDNTGWPDHVGTVEYVNEASGYITVIEGNYNDAVKKRTISINGRYIRGFIAPRYDVESAPIPTPPMSSGKNVETIARETISGLWGNNPKRKERIEAAGYNYSEVQAKINEILNVPKPVPSGTKKVTATCHAKSRSSALSRSYTTTTDVYCRNDAGTNKKALCKIPKGTKVDCFGYYTTFNSAKWYLIRFTLNGIEYTGFTHSAYLK